MTDLFDVPLLLDDLWFWIILTMLIAIGAFVVSFQRENERWLERNRAEFERLFPGRCYHCWHVRMAKAHGHAPPDAEPRPHECKEGPGD